MSLSKKKIGIIAGAVACAILGAVAGGVLYYENNLVWGTCYVEAGVDISPADFMKDTTVKASFSEGTVLPDTTVPGTYELSIDAQHMAHKTTLIVQDTIAPVAEVKPVTLTMGDTCGAEDFVQMMEDATQVSVSFVEEPDFTKNGNQDVQICFTDAGDNETVLSTTLAISQVIPDVYVEVGDAKPLMSDFVVGGGNPKLITNIKDIDYSKPQNVTVKIEIEGTTYDSTLHIQDTVAPEASFKSLTGFTHIKRKAEDFVESASDLTTLKYSFENEPDFELAGEQNLTVVVSDLGGNSISGEVTLTLEEDTEPPVIEGVVEISVFVNSPISYMAGVSITDNCPEGLKTSVEHSEVKSVTNGDYPITYIAEDAAGNITRVESVVHVKERVYDEATVYGAADRVLGNIINDGMSPYDKVDAIFRYVKSHISYVSGSDKNNYLRAAYEGLVDGKGDCYVYAATSKVLLTRAGIPNMDIAKIPSSTHHYWNLVDIGDGHGWYHFDTTPRKDHPTIFLWDEATLMAYSGIHYGSHNYDHAAYPAVP